MRLEIYDETKKDEPIKIILEPDSFGNIGIRARKNEIISGIILIITHQGTVIREPEVNSLLGFQLDDKGRIMEEE